MMDDFLNNKDIHLFLDTTRQCHSWGVNPYLIVGVFYHPKARKEDTPTLFDI